METYLYEGNVQKGPFELATLQSLAISGKISRQALYWQPGMEGWKPLSSLKVFVPPPPPNPFKRSHFPAAADAGRVYKIVLSQRRFWKTILVALICYTAALVLSLARSRAPWAEMLSLGVLVLALPAPFLVFWYYVRLRALLYSPSLAALLLLLCLAIPFFAVGEIIFTGFQLRKFYRLESIAYNAFGFPDSKTVQLLKP